MKRMLANFCSLTDNSTLVITFVGWTRNWPTDFLIRWLSAVRALGGEFDGIHCWLAPARAQKPASLIHAQRHCAGRRPDYGCRIRLGRLLDCSLDLGWTSLRAFRGREGAASPL